MSKKTPKPYTAMTTAELAEATKEYDQEMPGLPGKPLSKRGRELHERAEKRGRGRPRQGAGSAVVGVSIEKRLLAELDKLAKRRKVGRSELFVAALRNELASAVPAGSVAAAGKATKPRRRASAPQKRS